MKLILKTPDNVHNTYGIELVSDNSIPKKKKDEIIWFLALAKYNWLGIFIQGDEERWFYVEFLKTCGINEEKQDKLLKIAQDLSNFLKMPFKID